MKKLSKRLETIISVIDECYAVVDVGTDHAWLPIELVRRGISKKVYAIDNKSGPLEKAKANVTSAGLLDNIECILEDGLQNFREDVDVAIIAGVGVQTIISILEHAYNLQNYKRLVLQPNYGMPLLRKWLSEHGWGIAREKILFERNAYYEIVVAVQMVQPLTIEEIEFGPILMLEKSDAFIDKYNEELRLITNLILTISDPKKKHELLDRANKIKKVLQ